MACALGQAAPGLGRLITVISASDHIPNKTRTAKINKAEAAAKGSSGRWLEQACTSMVAFGTQIHKNIIKSVLWSLMEAFAQDG